MRTKNKSADVAGAELCRCFIYLFQGSAPAFSLVADVLYDTWGIKRHLFPQKLNLTEEEGAHFSAQAAL